MNMVRSNVLLGLVIGALVAGCASPKPEPEPLKLEMLSKGSEVSLMLLARLDSGGTGVGTKVPLVVASNVTGKDGVLIPAGTRVLGEVTQSRAAGALSSMLNSPARLRIRLLPITLPSGQTIELSGSMEQIEDFGFTGDTIESPNEALKLAIGDDAKRKVLQSISDLVEGTRSFEEVRSDLGSDESLRSLLNEIGSSKASELMGQKDTLERGFERLSSSLDKLKRGDVSSIASGDVVLALSLIEELGGVAASVGDTIKGAFKGRNIRPTVGSKIKVFVGTDVQLPVG